MPMPRNKDKDIEKHGGEFGPKRQMLVNEFQRLKKVDSASSSETCTSRTNNTEKIFQCDDVIFVEASSKEVTAYKALIDQKKEYLILEQRLNEVKDELQNLEIRIREAEDEYETKLSNWARHAGWKQAIAVLYCHQRGQPERIKYTDEMKAVIAQYVRDHRTDLMSSMALKETKKSSLITKSLELKKSGEECSKQKEIQLSKKNSQASNFNSARSHTSFSPSPASPANTSDIANRSTCDLKNDESQAEENNTKPDNQRKRKPDTYEPPPRPFKTRKEYEIEERELKRLEIWMEKYKEYSRNFGAEPAFSKSPWNPLFVQTVVLPTLEESSLPVRMREMMEFLRGSGEKFMKDMSDFAERTWSMDKYKELIKSVKYLMQHYNGDDKIFSHWKCSQLIFERLKQRNTGS